MNTKVVLGSLLACGLIAAGLTACTTEKELHESRAKAARLEAQAKVSRAEAEKTALANVPGGSIKEGEIEKEDGKLVWSFDIATSGATEITEVQVDAITGAVVSMEKETVAEQEKERQEEAKQRESEMEEKD